MRRPNDEMARAEDNFASCNVLLQERREVLGGRFETLSRGIDAMLKPDVAPRMLMLVAAGLVVSFGVRSVNPWPRKVRARAGKRRVPRYVEDELRGYLRCGVFAHGFVRCHCDACGHDLLVAFSCKGRAACPSCAGRRMSDAAAHLVDRVLPAVPVRQWVLSLPFELRGLAAFRADALSVLNRLFVEEVSRRYVARAKDQGFAKLDGPSVGGGRTQACNGLLVNSPAP